MENCQGPKKFGKYVLFVPLSTRDDLFLETRGCPKYCEMGEMIDSTTWTKFWAKKDLGREWGRELIQKLPRGKSEQVEKVTLCLLLLCKCGERFDCIKLLGKNKCPTDLLVGAEDLYWGDKGEKNPYIHRFFLVNLEINQKSPSNQFIKEKTSLPHFHFAKWIESGKKNPPKCDVDPRCSISLLMWFYDAANNSQALSIQDIHCLNYLQISIVNANKFPDIFTIYLPSNYKSAYPIKYYWVPFWK